MIPSRIFLCFIALLIIFFYSTLSGLVQNDQSVYYRNFVRHSSGEVCTHIPPLATFTVYLNNNKNRILIENAPRWTIGGDPNIPGNGNFGVELGNFMNPALAVGDTVFIRFTCNFNKEQGLLTGIATSIPWIYFPQTLHLSSVQLPDPPQNLTLTVDEQNHRIINWQQEPGISYSIYRRTVEDTVIGGQSRMLYQLIAEDIMDSSYIDSGASPDFKYGYIIYATSPSGIISSHSEEVNEEPVIPEGHDLTIGWIARLPSTDYVWGSSNPDVEGWPAVGQNITWHAVIKNWTTIDLQDVRYQWYEDSVQVLSGNINIPAGDTVGVDYPWVWTFDRHEIKLVIDPENLIPEEEEKNNHLMIFTNAISVGFYVEQSVYNYFHRYQKELNVHSNCWEDWAQRHVRRWNQMFADAIYPDTPDGVLDRIRIDKITVVPDGVLPLAGGNYPTNMPNLRDRTVDLQWGFPATLISGDMYNNHTSLSDNNPFYFEGSLLHELGHARYLIDLYGFNVHDNSSGNTVAIKENGKLIVGTEYMPLTGDAVHYTPIRGLMNGQYTYIDQYSAMALNLITGHRATMGNYNSPGNIGIFMNDLPIENCLTVKDNSGNLLTNADIKIYRATGKAGDWYGKFYDDIPDLQRTTNTNGQVYLGRCPFDSDGTIEHDYGKSNAVVIIRVEHEGKVGYTFLESTLFNMEFWRGNDEIGNYEINVKLISPSPISSLPEHLPTEYAVGQCYPNPFNASTMIDYHISRNSHIVAKVFDLMGRELITLLDRDQDVGQYHVKWDGTDSDGRTVSSGVYLIQFKTNKFTKILKAIYLK